MATFRQSTSRDDDPQIHTHAVISAKVQTADGRWYALDARYLKRHQRMLGGLYQSLLRSELTHRFGVGWEPIVNGQAEIAGVPRELLAVFSKRSVEIDEALTDKVEEFIDRGGRDADPLRARRVGAGGGQGHPRHKKSGHGVADLATRWRTEAEAVGWTGGAADRGDRDGRPRRGGTAGARGDRRARWSTTCRRRRRRGVGPMCCGRSATCSVPCPEMPAQRWLAVLERAADRVVEHCVDLDPPRAHGPPRASDGRSVWIEPTAAGVDERGGAGRGGADRRLGDRRPSSPTRSRRPRWTRDGLDVLQADAAAAVAG